MINGSPGSTNWKGGTCTENTALHVFALFRPANIVFIENLVVFPFIKSILRVIKNDLTVHWLFLLKKSFSLLKVVDLPAHDPTIEGLKVKYRIGDVLRANCTAGESAPATNLTWFVNGRRTDEMEAYQQHRISRLGRHMERHVIVASVFPLAF